MSKNKKPRYKGTKQQNKTHHKSSGAKWDVLQTIQTLGKEASLKKLFPALISKHSQEEIVIALGQLERSGSIKIGQKGIIFLKRAAGEKSSSGSSRKQDKRGHRSSVIGQSKFLFGTIDIAQSGIGFVTVDGEDKDVFIPRHKVRDALQGDEVKIRINTRGRRPEGEVLEIIKRSRDTFAGRIEVLEKFAFFMADEHQLKNDVFVPLSSVNGAKNDDRVIVRITDWKVGGKNPLGEVLEVLTGASSPDRDMKMILIENGFSIDFPVAVYKELAKVSEKIERSEIAKRLDLRSATTFTIDPEDAKDFDDAISVRELPNGNTEIGVHIADVSHYVTEGSALDAEAERRATSVYLPDRVCPMLPEKLSNVLCSLRPNEDKLTFSTLFEFDSELNFKNISIAKTIIHSRRRFTYEEAQQVIETGKGDCAAELKLLHTLSKKMRAKRMKKGAIAFEKDEVRFKLDETGKPTGIYLKTRKDAHLLVEDFMLLANETVARFGSKVHKGKKHSPFVYRVHNTPDPAKLEQFSAVAARFGYQIKFSEPKNAAGIFNTLLVKIQGKPEQNVLETLAIRSMAKAEYTTENIGHYGLAMEHYTHFTSPIRRYPDVLVHRLLSELLADSSKIIDKEELEGRCKNSSLMERKAMDAEREATKYKQIEFLQDKIGQQFDGIITGVIPRGIFVEMNENKCEGMVSVESLGTEDFVFDEKMVRLKGGRSGKKYELGDKVRVKVLSADIVLRRIDLEMV